jgi:hypothetical protein
MHFILVFGGFLLAAWLLSRLFPSKKTPVATTADAIAAAPVAPPNDWAWLARLLKIGVIVVGTLWLLGALATCMEIGAVLTRPGQSSSMQRYDQQSGTVVTQSQPETAEQCDHYLVQIYGHCPAKGETTSTLPVPNPTLEVQPHKEITYEQAMCRSHYMHGQAPC